MLILTLILIFRGVDIDIGLTASAVLIDFFIRHGLLTPENEPDYIEIMARLHRRFEFPTR